MIAIYVIIASLFSLSGVDDNIKKENHSIVVINSQSRKPTALDSMQGNWVSTLDLLHKIFVKDRIYHEVYVSRRDTIANHFYRIYFSDTLVEVSNFKNIKIDTTLTSGKYLILRSISDTDEFWSYRIDGFFLDRGYHTFVITDTWAKRRETAFRKVK